MQVSPKRSGIDFHKFEMDFAKSRTYHRLAQNNRTVGHTSILWSSTIRAPWSGGANSSRPSPPYRQPGGSTIGKATSPRALRIRGNDDQRGATHRVRARQRPLSASQIVSCKTPGRVGSNLAEKPEVCASDTRGAVARVVTATPRGSQTAGVGRRWTPPARPHSAPGLRRNADHRDLFDARAADPGWVEGSGGSRWAEQPPSASEKTEWGLWYDDDQDYSMKEDLSARRFLGGASRALVRVHEVVDDMHQGDVDGSKPQDADVASGNLVRSRGLVAGEHPLFQGRTLLAEAKVLVGAAGAGDRSTARKNCTSVSLQCSSLDGLVRQRGRVRKTLRGFVVHAARLPSRRTALSPHGGDQGGGNRDGSRVAGTHLTVSSVQAFVNEATTVSASNCASNSASLLKSFREASPLDDEGNYPELGTLMGLEGQRHLHQILLGSCRVVLSGGSPGGGVGVELLLAGKYEDIAISATVSDSNT